MKPIIVGTDFSEGSYMALELAIDVANRFQSDIILIWARREKLLFSDEQLDTMTNLAEDKLQMLCDKYQPAMKYGKMRWQITNGKVAPALATTATRELASMIIIGTNGASGFEKYWSPFGRVTTSTRSWSASWCPCVSTPIRARKCHPQPQWPRFSTPRCISSPFST